MVCGNWTRKWSVLRQSTRSRSEQKKTPAMKTVAQSEDGVLSKQWLRHRRRSSPPWFYIYKYMYAFICRVQSSQRWSVRLARLRLDNVQHSGKRSRSFPSSLPGLSSRLSLPRRHRRRFERYQGEPHRSVARNVARVEGAPCRTLIDPKNIQRLSAFAAARTRAETRPLNLGFASAPNEIQQNPISNAIPCRHGASNTAAHL